MADAIYTGVFLTEAGRKRLLEFFPPRHQNVYADHATLFFKPPPEVAEVVKALSRDLLEVMKFSVVSHVADEKGQAVGIEFFRGHLNGVMIKSEILHITISCAEGTSPVYSNTLMKMAETLPDKVSMYGELGVCSHSDRDYVPKEMWKRRGL